MRNMCSTSRVTRGRPVGCGTCRMPDMHMDVADRHNISITYIVQNSERAVPRKRFQSRKNCSKIRQKSAKIFGRPTGRPKTKIFDRPGGDDIKNLLVIAQQNWTPRRKGCC